MEKERFELRRLRDRLEQEVKERQIIQTKKMSSEIYERRQLLDLTHKETENVRARVSRCKDLSAEVITLSNEFDNCIKGMLL